MKDSIIKNLIENDIYRLVLKAYIKITSLDYDSALTLFYTLSLAKEVNEKSFVQKLMMYEIKIGIGFTMQEVCDNILKEITNLKT